MKRRYHKGQEVNAIDGNIAIEQEVEVQLVASTYEDACSSLSHLYHD